VGKGEGGRQGREPAPYWSNAGSPSPHCAPLSAVTLVEGLLSHQVRASVSPDGCQYSTDKQSY